MTYITDEEAWSNSKQNKQGEPNPVIQDNNIQDRLSDEEAWGTKEKGWESNFGTLSMQAFKDSPAYDVYKSFVPENPGKVAEELSKNNPEIKKAFIDAGLMDDPNGKDVTWSQAFRDVSMKKSAYNLWDGLKQAGQNLINIPKYAGEHAEESLASITGSLSSYHSDDGSIRPDTLLEGAMRPVQAVMGGFGYLLSPVSGVIQGVFTDPLSAATIKNPDVREQSSHELAASLAGLTPLPFPHGPSGMPEKVARARANNIIGVPEKVFSGAVEPTIEQAAAAHEAALQIPRVQEPLPDINTIANKLNPDVMGEHYILKSRENLFRTWLAELTEQRRSEAELSAPHAQEIADLESKMEDATPRLRKKYQERINTMQAERDAFIQDALSKDTEDMAKVREGLLQNDYRKRDILTDVDKTMRLAEDQLNDLKKQRGDIIEPEPNSITGNEQLKAETPKQESYPEPGTHLENGFFAGPDGERFRVGNGTKASPETSGGVTIEKRSEMGSESTFFVKKDGTLISLDSSDFKGSDIWKPNPEQSAKAKEILKRMGELRLDDPQRKILKDTLKSLVEGKDVEIPVRESSFPSTEQNEPIQKSTRELSNKIINEERSKWIAVGRTEEEADAIAKIVASRYATRSARFEGKHGTAEEMYARDDAEVRSGKKRARQLTQGDNAREFKGARGKIRLATDEAKAVITIFQKRANASTAIHELGHHWLDETMRDALEQDAPDVLRKDAKTIRNWLRLKEGKPIPKKAHEKFARGFERYLMEGIAPSKDLARVFAQFKQWLTNIYHTVTRLKSDINDDVRAVFDRMLEENPEKTKIEPDIEVEKGFEDTHLDDAKNTPPVLSAMERDRVRDERHEVIKQEIPEDYNALVRGSSAEIEGRSSGDGQFEGTNATTGSNVSQDGDIQTATVIPEGGANSGGEGGGLSEQPVSSGEPINTGSGERPTINDGRDTAATGGERSGNESAGKSENRINESSGREEPNTVDKAANIRLENLTDNESVKQSIRDLAEKNNQFIGARRGVVTDDEILKLAQSMGKDSKEINIKKLQDLSVKDDIPLAARILAGRQMLIEASIAADKAAKKVIEMGPTDQNLLELAEARRVFLMISETISGTTAEWGRAGRAFKKIPKEAMGRANKIDELFQNMSGMGREDLEKMAQAMDSMENPSQTANLLDNSTKKNFKKQITEYRLAAMLSGYKTHIKNTIDNATRIVDAIITASGASVTGKIFRATDRVRFNEVKAMTMGIVRGAIEGLQDAKNILKDENALVGGARTLDKPYEHAIPGKIGEFVRLPFRLLSAEDAIFRGIASRMRINELAAHFANKEGLDGDAWNIRYSELVNHPTEYMINEAEKFADYQTLTGKFEYGSSAHRVQQAINANFYLKNIIPFFRTNINSLDYHVGERTPLGLLSGKIWSKLLPSEEFKTDNPDWQIQQHKQFVKMAIGSSIITAVGFMAYDGIITGSAPLDRDEAAMMLLNGIPPNKIRIGDGYYSLDWIPGMGSAIIMMADIYKAAKSGVLKGDDSAHIITTAITALTTRLMNLSNLSGISDAINAAHNPDTAGEKFFQNYIGSYVPSILGNISDVEDPYVREVRNSFIDPIKTRIPVMRETLMTRKDLWGNAITKDAANVLTKDPVNKWLLYIGSRTGYWPAMPGKTISNVELTPQQYDEYIVSSGKLAKKQLDQLALQPAIMNLPVIDQLNLIKETIEISREYAKGDIMMKYPEIMDKAYEDKEMMARGEKTHKKIVHQ